MGVCTCKASENTKAMAEFTAPDVRVLASWSVRVTPSGIQHVFGESVSTGVVTSACIGTELACTNSTVVAMQDVTSGPENPMKMHCTLASSHCGGHFSLLKSKVKEKRGVGRCH